MLKGLAYTIPTIGRISIGKMVERNNRRLPQKDDHFSITTQAQRNGEWLPHPLQEALLAGVQAEAGQQKKLRAIPIKLMFNNPDLNFREQYEAFDNKTGRQLCVGDGEKAKRVVDGKIEETACPGPELCTFAQQVGCKSFGRLNVQIEGQEDEFSTFIFRTTGYNSIRTLREKLELMHAMFGANLIGLPLELRLRGKSTTMSYRRPFFYADITLREGVNRLEAMTLANEHAELLKSAGIDQAAMEQKAIECLKNGRFEDSEEEFLQMEEFLSNETPVTDHEGDDAGGDQPAKGMKALQQELLHDSAAEQSPVTGTALESREDASQIGDNINLFESVPA